MTKDTRDFDTEARELQDKGFLSKREFQDANREMFSLLMKTCKNENKNIVITNSLFILSNLFIILMEQNKIAYNEMKYYLANFNLLVCETIKEEEMEAKNKINKSKLN